MLGLYDTSVALRIIYLLVKPIESFDAFKLGLIDADGKRLRFAVTSEEKAATSMLFRLVWNMRRIVSIVPGGSTKIGTLAAAYLLMKESIAAKHTETESLTYFNENIDRVTGLDFENKDIVEDAFAVLLGHDLHEDAPANSAGAGVSTDTPMPLVKKPLRRFKEFNVSEVTMKKFTTERIKFRKGTSLLDLNDSVEKEIYDFMKDMPRGVVVLKDAAGKRKVIKQLPRLSSGKPKAIAESILYNIVEVETL